MTKLLIVDDDAHTVAVLSLWLKRHGYETIEAPDGLVALEVLERESVDLIISDVNMPRVNGTEFVAAVRDGLGLDVPILLLSSRCDQASLAREMERYGVALYPKPFMPSRLVAEVERQLAGIAG